MPILPPARIISENHVLRHEYHRLRSGDIFLGRLRLKATEEHLLIDLVERGVILYPSALSQLLCRSKVFQAHLYAEQMLPFTVSAHDQHDVLEAVNLYQKNGIIGKVVTKLDRKNAGMGIHLWHDVENVFTHATLGFLPFPFVIQPFSERSRDIRVVILGDYIESYARRNPNNFRNNLHCGGQSAPCELAAEQLDLCRQVMSRGKFPYAHIDLMIVESGKTFLAEINLRGGIKGAQINPADYSRRVEEIHRNFLKLP